MSIPAAAEIVLGFWFDETPPERWFRADAAFDEALRTRFGPLHAALAAGLPPAWSAAPRPLLAAVIVLDQFSRNLARGEASAFANDTAALALTRAALQRGDDAALSGVERQFLYMPLLHSEALADQDRSVALYAALGNAEAADFARQHREVIARFGRFPGRNAALGRPDAPAETAFLAAGGAGF